MLRSSESYSMQLTSGWVSQVLNLGARTMDQDPQWVPQTMSQLTMETKFYGLKKKKNGKTYESRGPRNAKVHRYKKGLVGIKELLK